MHHIIRILKVISITLRIAVFSFLLGSAIVSETLAHSAKNGDIEIIHPWVEPSWGKSSKVHAIVSNEGLKSLDLLRIETPNNLKFRLFKSGKVANKITVPAEEIIEFSGELYTIEIFSLSEPLRLGEKFPAIFYFSQGIAVHVIMAIGEVATVKSIGTTD